MTVELPPTPPEPPFSVREPFLLGRTDVTRVTLVRHAQQDYPVADTFDFADWDDPPLSGLGRVQAHAVAALLGEQHVDVIACSTMRRAMDTAEIVASPHDIKPVVRRDLREIDSYRDVPAGARPQDLVSAEEWQARQDLFRREVMWEHMPFGEPAAEFKARCLGAMDEVIAEHVGEHVVFISHGGVINAFLGRILGIEEDMFFLPSHCSLSTAVVGADRSRVHSMNETQHLHIGILTN